jgi:hypothetical protein
MNEDLESLVEPQPEDTMENHAEQHSAMTRLQKEISERVNNGEVLQASIADKVTNEVMTKSGSQFIETPWKVKEETSTYIVIEDGEQYLYHVATPTASPHAANKGYVDENDVDPEQWEPTFGMPHTYDYTINSHYPNDYGWEYAKYRVHGNSPIYVNLQTGSHGTSDNFDLEWKFETNGSKMNWHFPADTEGYPTMKIANASVEINGKLKINGQQVDPASIVFDMSQQQRKIEELTQMVNELKARLDGREND